MNTLKHISISLTGLLLITTSYAATTTPSGTPVAAGTSTITSPTPTAAIGTLAGSTPAVSSIATRRGNRVVPAGTLVTTTATTPVLKGHICPAGNCSPSSWHIHSQRYIPNKNQRTPRQLQQANSASNQ